MKGHELSRIKCYTDIWVNAFNEIQIFASGRVHNIQTNKQKKKEFSKGNLS